MAGTLVSEKSSTPSIDNRAGTFPKSYELEETVFSCLALWITDIGGAVLRITVFSKFKFWRAKPEIVSGRL